MQSRLLQLYNQLTSGDNAHPVLVPVRAVVRWCLVFYRKLLEDRAFIRASGMAYITLISLVPLVLLVFSILGATGVLESNKERIEDFIYVSFPPLEELARMYDFDMAVVMQVELGPLGVVGGLGMLFVAARLYLMVEGAYNDVFGVAVDRAISLRLLNFYFTLTAIPVVAVVAILNTDALMQAAGYGAFSGWLTTLTVFVVLFGALKLFPCTRVKWRAAAAGAAASGLMLELGGRIFPLYVTWWFAADDPTREIYGSLGVVPVFLLWLYLTWVFVLLGVEVAYVAQNFESLVEAELEQSEQTTALVRSPSMATAIEAATRVAWAFEHGEGPVPTARLAKAGRVSSKELHLVMRVLERCGFVLRTEEGWMIARSPATIRVGEIAEAWRTQTEIRSPGADPVGDALADAVSARLEGTLVDAMDWWVDDADALPEDTAEVAAGPKLLA